MKKVTQYIADDGKSFDTEADCIAHEAKQNALEEVQRYVDNEYPDPKNKQRFRNTCVRVICKWIEHNARTQHHANDDVQQAAADPHFASRRPDGIERHRL